MKKIFVTLFVAINALSFAQSWQTKTIKRIENTDKSFYLTFFDSSSAYIQKQNVSYIVTLPNTNYLQIGYMYEGSTSRIITIQRNLLTQPISISASELADTLNYWLGFPSSGSGGSQTLSISNDTLSISGGNSVVLPSGTSALFPNGVKLVTSSRDFQADDKDYVLLCPVPGTIITMPTTNPFSEGDYIGVVMSSPDSYFETYNNVIYGTTDKMYPYTANPTGTTLEQQSSSEVVILRALNQGTLWILPLCGAVKYSNDINGSNFKTLARYNYDQSQNAIPLSGTEIGKPVTGDIELTNTYRFFSTVDNLTGYIGFDEGNPYLTAINTDTYESMTVVLTDIGLSINTANPNGKRGIIGQEDFTPNITDLDYTQKKYVDTHIAFTSVPTSSTDTGVKGQMAVDATYLYVCVATDTWTRVALIW